MFALLGTVLQAIKACIGYVLGVHCGGIKYASIPPMWGMYSSGMYGIMLMANVPTKTVETRSIVGPDGASRPIDIL